MTILACAPDESQPVAAVQRTAASAGGAVKAIQTTPLMTVEEGVEAMRKAGGAGYRPPGS